jgi:hypothetical protein
VGVSFAICHLPLSMSLMLISTGRGFKSKQERHRKGKERREVEMGSRGGEWQGKREDAQWQCLHYNFHLTTPDPDPETQIADRRFTSPTYTSHPHQKQQQQLPVCLFSRQGPSSCFMRGLGLRSWPCACAGSCAVMAHKTGHARSQAS